MNPFFPATLLLFCSLAGPIAMAQPAPEFQKRQFTTKRGQVLPYRILYPENYDRSRKYPLVLLLHGAGERGNDNEKQLTHGSKLFLEAQTRRQYPAFVVMPQCPQDTYWSSVKIDGNQLPLPLRFDYNDQPNWPLQAALDLVKQLQQEERIDKNRLYIMGLSMGGMGTFEVLSRYPKRFAAAVPICGGGDPNLAGQYAQQLPLWVFHGSEDNVVAVKYSREMVAKLQSLHGQVKYTEYPGVNHNSWDNAFAEPELLPWLFAQHRNKRRR